MQAVQERLHCLRFPLVERQVSAESTNVGVSLDIGGLYNQNGALIPQSENVCTKLSKRKTSKYARIHTIYMYIYLLNMYMYLLICSECIYSLLHTPTLCPLGWRRIPVEVGSVARHPNWGECWTAVCNRPFGNTEPIGKGSPPRPSNGILLMLGTVGRNGLR